MNPLLQTGLNGQRVRVKLACSERRVTVEGRVSSHVDALLGNIVRIELDVAEDQLGLPPVLCVRQALFASRCRVDHESSCDWVVDLT